MKNKLVGILLLIPLIALIFLGLGFKDGIGSPWLLQFAVLRIAAILTFIIIIISAIIGLAFLLL